MTGRSVLLVTHTGREQARALACTVADALTAAGIEVQVPAAEAADLGHPSVVPVPDELAGAAEGCEVAVVLGGDGTMLRTCELVRAHGTPILGVNMGHVGFLAEAEPDDVATVVDALVHRRWHVEERLALDVTVARGGTTVAHTWALNEASIEKATRERMVELLVEVDGRPLSRWGGDGVVCATPTGSTAYAFSAGGPVVWPNVEALVVVPISAHALFARPLVLSPQGRLAVEVLDGPDGVLWCDGRRRVDLPVGSRVEVTRSPTPVRLARLHHKPFTDRLVAKFALPVGGWRGGRG